MDGILLAIDADGERAIDRAETVADLPTGATDVRATPSRVFEESSETAPAGRVDDA
jgi:hypothetical protein